MKDNGKLLLIDSHSLGYRAFYALPLLATSTGIYTNAIYGFMTMLIPLLENEKPDYCIAVFDTPHITFRHQLYAEYKAQRERSPKEFSEQLPLLKEILTKGFRIPALELDGYEADDLIGTITNLAEQKGLRSIIVTGDGDLLQLVSRLTSVRLTRRGITDLHSYTPESILQKYGLTPEQLIDYKGLKGDPSDNIPGVPGIGDKTATRLLQEYGNLENILLHGHKIKGKRVGDNLKKYAKQALISKELATIKRDVPLDFSWNDCRLKKPDYKVLTSQFRELEFKRLLDKLPAVEDSSPVIEKTAFSNNRSIASLEALRHYCKKLEETGYLSFIYEKVYSANLQCFVGCLGLSTGEGDGCYLFFTPDAKKGTMPQAKVWQILRPYLEDSDLLKYSHNLKPLYKQCKENGILLRNAVFDTYIAAYLLDPLEDEYTLEALMERYLDCRLFTKTSKHEQKDFPQRGALLAAASQALFPLKERLHSLLQERELDRLYYDLEFPLIFVLAEMELQGIKVDVEKLQELKQEISERLLLLEKEIYGLAGEKFNLNSPKQLAEILFQKLNLPIKRRTKTGYSTDARVLAELAKEHEIAKKLLDYRQLTKLEGTYLSGFSSYIHSETKKIHTTFNQTVTATGRLSSSEPNLQNIPIRFAEGRRIREAFIPSEPGWVFLAADYSQIELRVLAHLSKDPTLLEAFIKGEDIHQRTAAEIFATPPEEVTPLMRNRAKAINFGIIYGMSDYGLAQDIDVSREEARKYIESYFERYQGVKAYMEEIISQARQTGYVTTILNRRRYLPEINAVNFSRRSFAERTARNTPIQGSAADIIKLAMLKISELLQQNRDQLKARLLLQIHDELIFEVPVDELSKAAELVLECMENAYLLAVPLKVDLKTGKNLYHMHPYKIKE